MHMNIIVFHTLLQQREVAQVSNSKSPRKLSFDTSPSSPAHAIECSTFKYVGHREIRGPGFKSQGGTVYYIAIQVFSSQKKIMIPCLLLFVQQ